LVLEIIPDAGGGGKMDLEREKGWIGMGSEEGDGELGIWIMV